MSRKIDPWKQVQRAIKNGDSDATAHWRAECAKEESARFAAARARAERRANGPLSILRDLPVGGEHLFTQYRIASQLSSTLQTLKRWHGTRFKCATEFDLVTGETVIGVRVTRIV